MSETVDIDISDNPGSTNKVSTRDEGRTYTYSSGSTTITIKVSEVLAEIATYKKLVYNLPQKSTIQSIKYKGGNTNIPTHSKSTFNVYYWVGDRGYTTPLIVQVDGNCYEYDKDQWNRANIASKNLNNGLNQQNCKRNKAHKLDISQTGGPYTCTSSFCSKRFIITPDDRNKDEYKYVKYKFSPENSENPRFLYFTHRYIPQIGLPYPENVNYVNTYWKTDKGVVNSPSLIHYTSRSKNIWYKAKDNEQNKWEEISELGIDEVVENSAANIKRLISGNYLPTITIDTSRVDTPESTYADIDSQETISVSKHIEDLKDYEQFLHKPKDDVCFRLKTVKHGITTLLGIETQGIFASVTTYYWNGDKGHKTPLLIELVTGERTSKYTYYRKKTKDANTWTQLSVSGGVNGKFDEGKLKPILDELKKVHFTSNTTTIIGGAVGGVVGGGGVIGLGIWKGPSLLARLIARL